MKSVYKKLSEDYEMAANLKYTPRRTRFLRYFLGILIGVTIAVILFFLFDLSIAQYPNTPILFEDGSFILYRITGCLPWGICN